MISEGDDELLRREQAHADAALARRLQEQENDGRLRPTGNLTHIGYDEVCASLLSSAFRSFRDPFCVVGSSAAFAIE
jgi:hypothetical protein